MTGSWRFNDVTAAADFWPITDTINVSNSQPCQLATFTGQISGDDVLDDEHEVIVYYTPSGGSEGKVFAGDVSVYTRSQFDIAANDNYSFSARDYTARLDDTILTDAKRDAETVDDAIAWIMGVAPTFDLTNGAAESISTMLPAYDYTGNSKREALQHIAGIVGAVFYIDFDKALQFYLADTTFASDFDLSTSPDNSTTFPYANFRLDSDTTERADDVWAQGDGVAAWRPTSTPSGGRQRSVNASGVKDLDTIQAIADAELERIGTAQVSGTLTTWTAGLISGQTVHIVNSTHSIDDDFVISQISIRYMQPNDLGGTSEFTVQFADRLTCRPQIDLSNTGGSDGNGDGGGCGRAVVLTDLDSELSLESGPDDAIYLHDGSSLAKFRVDLQTKVFEVSASGGVPYVTHQPGTYVPLCLGDKAYRRDNGVQRWSITDDLTALAAQTQDARRFWVTGTTGSGAPIGFPFSGMGTFTADFGPTGASLNYTVWRGYTTSGGSVKVALASGGQVYFYGSTSGWNFERLRWVTDTGWSDAGTPPSVADIDSYLAGASGPGGNGQVVGAGSVGSAKAVGWYGVGSTSAQDPESANGSFGTVPAGQWVILMMANDVGSGHDQTSVAHGLQVDFTVSGTAVLDGPLSGPGGPVIQVRETLDGTLVTSVDLSDDGTSMRRSASGEFAMVQQSTDIILRFDKDANLDDTVTITDFFPTDDWNVDDAYNLYQLLDNVLTKYDPAGTVLWTVDLNARHSYLFPSLVTTGNGNQVIADDFVRVCGYIGGADWSTDPSEACLITLSKVDGSTKIIQRFGGDSDDNAQAEALHHHLDGCIFLAGAAAGTEFEGLTLSGTQGWLMRVGADDITDPGSEIVPAAASDLTDHLTDPTDAHDASAVSIVDSGSYFTGTDVEAALQELGAGGGGGAPTTATYITQTHDGTLSAEQALGDLATGLLKNTTTTGVLSIAAAGTDYQAADADLTTIAGLTATTDSFMQAKSSAWSARTITQVIADLIGGIATALKSGGSNAVKLDEWAATTDVTTLNATTSAHGLLKKLDNNSAHFMDGTGAWSTPGGGTGPGTELDYVQVTSNVTVSGASIAAATNVVTGTSISYDGTPVIIEFFCSDAAPGNADTVAFDLFDGAPGAGGGTALGSFAVVSISGTSGRTPVLARVRITPSAATHQYSVGAHRSSSNGTVEAGAGGAGTTRAPAYIRVTKV